MNNSFFDFNVMTKLLLIAFIFLISACSTVDLASQKSDTSGKKFITKKDKSIVYVIQNGGYGSRTTVFPVSINGNQIGSLSRFTYFKKELPPGEQIIVISSVENQKMLRLKTKPNTISFVEFTATIGWNSMRVNTISELSPEKGKEAVLNSKMAFGFGTDSQQP
jgi:hypothetical protein